jgi:hypothetical protein
VERYVGLVADDPAVVPGRDVEELARAHDAFGPLLKTVYPEPGFTTTSYYNNFHRNLGRNPC